MWDFQRNVSNGVKVVVIALLPHELGEQLANGVGALLDHTESLRDVFELYSNSRRG